MVSATRAAAPAGRLRHRRSAAGQIATLAQSPVFGGRVKSVDDAAAKAVKGVRQIVRLHDAVARRGRPYGAAKKGLAALVIEWDDGPHAKLDTQAIVAELEKATLNSGGGRAEYRPLGGIAIGLRMQANQAACTPLRVAFLSDNVTYARGVTII
jgi:hypothetical protein